MSRRGLRRSGQCAIVAAFVVLFGGLDAGSRLHAQYFGRNKVQYDHFDFRVLKTEHFDLHYYPEERDAALVVARLAERWYARLSRILDHALTSRQPVVLYASHRHFEQTNVVEGLIEEGVGGVTEGLLRRVTLPMAASVAETDHVLGHELVHAFQYDMLGEGSEGLPLWFIEGMAEYLSVGPRDVQTSMWLRDALLHEKLPSIKDLNNPRYFPYRFGHALWAYVGGRWGDEAIGRILRDAASAGTGQPGSVDALGALTEVTGLTQVELSDAWHQDIRGSYARVARPAPPDSGERVIGRTTGQGRLNVGGALSPDGSRLAFLSSRGQLSIDLYLADTATGRVTRKLIDTESDPHFDSLEFLASAGTWDPAGRQLAVATLSGGRPALVLLDVETGRTTREIPLPDLGEIMQPAWSPDGKSIAFSAQVGGFTDLFVFDLASGQTRRLTTDQYADLQPAWSPDGRRLTFVTDRASADFTTLAFSRYGLASIDVASLAITTIATGLPGNATNPQWSADGRSLFFLSDAGGFPDAYVLDPARGSASRLTAEPTGVAGITALSPALSFASAAGLASATVFNDGGFDIHLVRLDPAAARPAPPAANKDKDDDAARLPPLERRTSRVAAYLADPATGLPSGAAAASDTPYHPHLSLMSLGAQVGAGMSSGYGLVGSGGAMFLLGDLLGNHMVGASLQLNGGVRDLGANILYLNRTNRWNWGIFGERMPFSSGTGSSSIGTVGGGLVLINELNIFREVDSSLGGLVAYPLSRASRIELHGAARSIGFQRETEVQTFDLGTGLLIGEERHVAAAAPTVKFGDVGAALVHDTAAIGPTSPLVGSRARLDLSQWIGDLRITTLTADYRRYIMPVKPVTLAGRLLHVGRYGSDADDSRLFPLFLGYPNLVRGYDPGGFDAAECTPSATSVCPQFDRLFGSRVLVANGEVRAPLVGLFSNRVAYGPLPIEIFAFGDAGVAWSRTIAFNGARQWVSSVGAGVRVNVFGYFVGEMSLVRPLSRPVKGWMFVFNLQPGF